MATIVKLDRASGIRYKAIIRKNGRVLTTKTFTRKGDAKEWSKRIEADQEQMQALGSTGAGLTFETLADEYVAQWIGKDSQYLYRLDYWRKHFGTTKVTAINAGEIRRILERYEDGEALRGDGHGRSVKSGRKRSPASVNRLRACLSSVLNYAYKQGYIATNPVKRVPGKTEKNQRVRFLSEEERPALLAACRDSQWPKLELVVAMALTTGARQGELLKLRWSDVDFNAKLAHCHDTKNGDDRLLPLPPVTLELLKKWREAGDGLIFPSARIPSKPFTFRKHWEKALKAAGIENFRFHDLRHDAASRLVMSGATLYETAEILGHKSVQTTKRYAHLSTQHKAEVVNRVFGEI